MKKILVSLLMFFLFSCPYVSHAQTQGETKAPGQEGNKATESVDVKLNTPGGQVEFKNEPPPPPPVIIVKEKSAPPPPPEPPPPPSGGCHCNLVPGSSSTSGPLTLAMVFSLGLGRLVSFCWAHSRRKD